MAASGKQSKAAIERSRAAAARRRFQQYKKRQASARKGWETRRTDDAAIYDRMVKWLSEYKETASKKSYAHFRQNKRFLYDIMGARAEDIVYGAAQDAGWDVTESVRFAKLS